MRQKMSDKHKLMAYVLSTDEDLNREKNITQKAIADMFNVSQATVAQAIKESRYRLRINELEQELTKIKKEILNDGRIEVLGLPRITDGEYKRKP